MTEQFDAYISESDGAMSGTIQEIHFQHVSRDIAPRETARQASDLLEICGAAINGYGRIVPAGGVLDVELGAAADLRCRHRSARLEEVLMLLQRGAWSARGVPDQTLQPQQVLFRSHPNPILQSSYFFRPRLCSFVPGAAPSGATSKA